LQSCCIAKKWKLENQTNNTSSQITASCSNRVHLPRSLYYCLLPSHIGVVLLKLFADCVNIICLSVITSLCRDRYVYPSHRAVNQVLNAVTLFTALLFFNWFSTYNPRQIRTIDAAKLRSNFLWAELKLRNWPLSNSCRPQRPILFLTPGNSTSLLKTNVKGEVNCAEPLLVAELDLRSAQCKSIVNFWYFSYGSLREGSERHCRTILVDYFYFPIKWGKEQL